MFRYGLKLWSTNTDLFSEAASLCRDGQADLVELYLVPGFFKEEKIKILKSTAITVHAPYYMHGFNVFELDQNKIDFFNREVIGIANFLNAENIVLHAGAGRNQKIFKDNIVKIYDERIIIENKPKIGVDKKICFGYSLKQLQFIKEKCELKICFDVVHAVKSAISQKIDYKEYLKKCLEKLQPDYFHLCGAGLDNEIDEHLNLFEGGLDWLYIKKILVSLAKDREIILIFEVPKEGRGLNNDLKNIRYFKSL